MIWKKICISVFLILSCFTMFNILPIYAAETTIEDATSSGLGDGFDQSIIDNLNQKTDNSNIVFREQLYRIWNTLKWVIWVLSFIGILIAGVRYIFAGIEAKADLKQGLLKLVIGIILVDAASLVIEIIVNIFYEVI